MSCALRLNYLMAQAEQKTVWLRHLVLAKKEA